ncbi:MAG: domain S-box, partial [Capsulimonas sp.]|nr:domain S-box [Capsulimonas sp.]
MVGDAEGNIIDMNPVSLRLHGFATIAEARRHLRDFPDTFEFWDSNGKFVSVDEWPLARTLAGERFTDCVINLRRIDTGVRRWVNYGGAPLMNANGLLEYVVLTARDITQQRETELALQQSEQRSRQAQESVTTILESISDAFFGLDRQWRFTYLNPQTEPLLQRKREELLGKSIWEEFPAAVNNLFYEQYGRAMRENIAVQFTEIYPPLGAWFEVNAYPTSDGLGVYFRDVSQQLLLKEQQRDAAQRQRAFARDVLSSVTDGRLQLCQTQEELPEPLEKSDDWILLTREDGMHHLRERAKDGVRIASLGEDRTDDTATAASEAAMNAVVHAGDGL